jgi:DNA-binding protein
VIRKLTLVAAFAAGYVLGSKAGIQRYQQIRSTAKHLADQPVVHSTTEKVQAKATEVVDVAKGKAVEKAHDAVDSVKGKAQDAVGQVKDKVTHPDDQTPATANGHPTAAGAAASDTAL